MFIDKNRRVISYFKAKNMGFKMKNKKLIKSNKSSQYFIIGKQNQKSDQEYQITRTRNIQKFVQESQRKNHSCQQIWT